MIISLSSTDLERVKFAKITVLFPFRLEVQSISSKLRFIQFNFHEKLHEHASQHNQDKDTIFPNVGCSGFFDDKPKVPVQHQRHLHHLIQ